MSTFSQTYIKSKDVDTVLAEFKKYLSIGREIWFDTRKEWFYNIQHEDNPSTEKNLTLMFAKNQSKEWIEIEIDFGNNLYFYDEILRRISKTLNAEILLGYFQSTLGEGRLAKFKNGQLELSFFEQYYHYNTIDRIYVADNFGVLNSNIETLKKVKTGKDSSLISHDFIYKFYKSEGWSNDLDKDCHEWMFLHVEQLS